MLTIEKLRAWGADTEDGLKRCMNNEAFYLRLAEKAAQDPAYDKLKEAVEAHDLAAAFEAAHALKGSVGNLSLTPIYEPVSELTERLRGKSEIGDDEAALLDKVMSALDAVRKLAE